MIFVKTGLNVGSTNAALFGKYWMEMVLASGGTEAPVSEYTPQPENRLVVSNSNTAENAAINILFFKFIISDNYFSGY
jgi:hypothetical protein